MAGTRADGGGFAGPVLRACGADEVFNLPLVDAFFVVDTRTAAEVAAEGGQRMATAISLPPPGSTLGGAGGGGNNAEDDGGGGGGGGGNDDRSPGVLAVDPTAPSHTTPSLGAYFAAFLAEVEEDLLWPAAWKKMVVYGAAGTTYGRGGADAGMDTDAPPAALTSRDYTMRVAEALQAYLAHNTREGSTHYKANLFRKVEAVLVLDGGYPVFRRAYPMLCGVELADMTPTPVLITPHIFLRPRSRTGLPITTATLAPWGITHVVEDEWAAREGPQSGWHNMEGTAEADRALLHIQRLLFPVPSDGRGLGECFSPVVAYVAGVLRGEGAPGARRLEAPACELAGTSNALVHATGVPAQARGVKTTGGPVRILLSVGDQATSASFAVACLMAIEGVPLDTAYERVQGCLHRRLSGNVFSKEDLEVWWAARTGGGC